MCLHLRSLGFVILRSAATNSLTMGLDLNMRETLRYAQSDRLTEHIYDNHYMPGMGSNSIVEFWKKGTVSFILDEVP